MSDWSRVVFDSPPTLGQLDVLGCFPSGKNEVKPWDEWSKRDFEVGRALGSGGFGEVFLARTVARKKFVALKVLKVEDILNDNMTEDVNREIDIQSGISHKNILKMYGDFQDGGDLIFVLEYAPGGDLSEFMDTQPNFRFTVDKTATYIYQTTDALQYLHSNRIMHRDIKPENILLGAYGEIKIADFGCSIQTKTANPRQRTYCGTLEYQPPEMIAGKVYNFSMDIWAIGVLCFELLTGNPPFVSKGRLSAEDRIQDGRVVFPRYIDEEARAFIRHIIVLDPKDRPKSVDIMEHDWVETNRIRKLSLLPMFQNSVDDSDSSESESGYSSSEEEADDGGSDSESDDGNVNAQKTGHDRKRIRRS